MRNEQSTKVSHPKANAEPGVSHLEQNQSLMERVAGVEGLEPPTPGFGDRCSGQLSYTPTGRRAHVRNFGCAAPQAGCHPGFAYRMRSSTLSPGLNRRKRVAL
jgi:hypothetical protein